MSHGIDTGGMTIEARTIQKVRIRILPFVFLLFVVCFLDRINTGFAALTMNKELAITGQQYGLLFGIFFFGCSIFEIPSNLLLHKIGARIWIFNYLGNRSHVDWLRAHCPSALHCSLSSGPG